MIYLASPYSHDSARIMEERYRNAAAFTSRMMRAGHVIFSPIVYGHQLAEAQSLPTDAQWWKEFNETIIRACSDMWVLRLAGWEYSKGVQMEIALANELNMPLYYKDL